MKLTRDTWAGLAVLAASLFLFWMTLELKESPLVPIGPGFYPRIVLGVTAVFALALVVSGWLGKKGEKPLAQANYGAVVLQFAVFGLYIGSMPWLGFRLATFAYVAGTNLLMAPPRRPLDWGRAVLLGVLTAAATYFAFEQYLSVLLPRGRWTGW